MFGASIKKSEGNKLQGIISKKTNVALTFVLLKYQNQSIVKLTLCEIKADYIFHGILWPKGTLLLVDSTEEFTELEYKYNVISNQPFIAAILPYIECETGVLNLDELKGNPLDIILTVPLTGCTIYANEENAYHINIPAGGLEFKDIQIQANKVKEKIRKIKEDEKEGSEGLVCLKESYYSDCRNSMTYCNVFGFRGKSQINWVAQKFALEYVEKKQPITKNKFQILFPSYKKDPAAVKIHVSKMRPLGHAKNLL